MLGKRKHATSPIPLPVKNPRTIAPPAYAAPVPAPYAAPAPASYAAPAPNPYASYYGAAAAPPPAVDPNVAFYAQQGYAPYQY